MTLEEYSTPESVDNKYNTPDSAPILLTTSKDV